MSLRDLFVLLYLASALSSDPFIPNPSGAASNRHMSPKTGGGLHSDNVRERHIRTFA
jgi:hypothetical protein